MQKYLIALSQSTHNFRQKHFPVSIALFDSMVLVTHVLEGIIISGVGECPDRANTCNF